MVALNFIFLLIFLGLFAAISIPFIALFIIGIWKRRRWMKWGGGIPAAVILIAALCGFCLLIYGFLHPWTETSNAKTIQQSFVSNFGFTPGADFKPEKQKIYCLADYGCMHMTFQASPETFEKIRAIGFEPISRDSFESETGGSKAPPWWINAGSKSADCFTNTKWKGSFSSNAAYLLYDNTSNRVYFFSRGID